MKSLFTGQPAKEADFAASLKHYLETTCRNLRLASDPHAGSAFLGHLEALLQSEEPAVQHVTLRWALRDFIRYRHLPEALHQPVFDLIRPCVDGWLWAPLLAWLKAPDAPFQNDVIVWLAALTYTRPRDRQHVIEALLLAYLQGKCAAAPCIHTLKQLDQVQGDVTDLALHWFPTKSPEQNNRIIHLLGKTGRYRIIRPLISYVKEYPEYLRVVMKAFSALAFDEVDQFYLDCLKPAHHAQPMVLVEAIKQVRRRRLRKAIPLLDTLFPREYGETPLLDLAINGEIALTMASFGAYLWGKEKLLAEMILNGVNPKYLKAVDRLNLQEAVPLLKAIMLMPETPNLVALQHQAYRICERLLLEQSALNKSLTV